MAAFSRLRRFSEIGTVAAKYGLTRFIPTPLISVLKLENTTGDDRSFKELRIEERFRLAFEELGATFIKMGQILSSRSDVIPQSMADEFKKLTDNVRPMEFSQIKPIIEEELTAQLDEIFADFNETPLAAASISQVYSAVLKETGEKVVVKVRKPGVVETIKSDMEIIIWFADILHKTSSHSKNINFKGIAEEFFWTMNQELDLVIEKSNNQKLAENFDDEKWSWLHFPLMHEKYCTGKVLVMEKINGLKLPEVVLNNDPARFDRKIIADRGARALMKMILSDGFFHADLHQGNIFFVPGNGIVAIDCGMCGRVDRFMRERIVDMFIAFVAKDYEKIADIYIDISESGVPANKADFVRDVRKILESLPDNIAEINTAQVVQQTFSTMFRHKLKIPREFTQLIKSLSQIEGLCRELDPEFELLTVAEKLSKELFAERYSPERIAGDVFVLLLKTVDLLKKLPGMISNIAEKIENGTIQHRFLILFGRSERSFISRMVTRVCSAFIVTGSLIASGSISDNMYLYVVYTVFSLSIFVFILTFRKGSENDER